MKASFQIILIIIFMAGAILGILVFSGAIPIGKSSQPGALGTVTIWGTVPSSLLIKPLDDFNKANPTFVVNYAQKSEDTFDHDLLEALATGTGPDMVFLPDNLVYHYSNKLTKIPFTSYPLASFKTNFASASEVFLAPDGILAFPLAIDPFMMYYNRSMLDANGITLPPTTWGEMSSMVPTLTKKDDTNKILKSAVALGHASNILHMKDIVSTLFMQTGNPIMSFQNGIQRPALNTGTSLSGLVGALKFYTSFSDPTSTVYSWNKSFPEARDAFSKEDLAFYFGYASELPSLINQNPNQNFFVASVPQVDGAKFKLTAGKVTGIAILSSSPNLSTAFTAAGLLASSRFADQFRNGLGIAPARRDLLAQRQTDAYSPIFYNSALYAKSWLDPSPVDTDKIFSNMVESVVSNSMTPDNAIKDADSKMSLLLLR